MKTIGTKIKILDNKHKAEMFLRRNHNWIRSYTKIGAGRIGGESGQGDCSHEREGCPSEVRF